ncbi:MAG: LOW QUALITY PROTEIN: uncharacterized protein KVP18_000059 [Porospora cf. gigantea A]|uniref:uncharacterized protein n=1 Tax=Porospora cf. gigantea A TaxID=2853593 RepID=UPI00355A9CD5|nr:MAG: LOW QUALITY PROTEIN: hypothetical protein KVP18_000059 [Porospora cf. gigantea A]
MPPRRVQRKRRAVPFNAQRKVEPDCEIAGSFITNSIRHGFTQLTAGDLKLREVAIVAIGNFFRTEAFPARSLAFLIRRKNILSLLAPSLQVDDLAIVATAYEALTVVADWTLNRCEDSAALLPMLTASGTMCFRAAEAHVAVCSRREDDRQKDVLLRLFTFVDVMLDLECENSQLIQWVKAHTGRLLCEIINVEDSHDCWKAACRLSARLEALAPGMMADVDPKTALTRGAGWPLALLLGGGQVVLSEWAETLKAIEAGVASDIPRLLLSWNEKPEDIEADEPTVKLTGRERFVDKGERKTNKAYMDALRRWQRQTIEFIDRVVAMQEIMEQKPAEHDVEALLLVFGRIVGGVAEDFVTLHAAGITPTLLKLVAAAISLLEVALIQVDSTKELLDPLIHLCGLLQRLSVESLATDEATGVLTSTTTMVEIVGRLLSSPCAGNPNLEPLLAASCALVETEAIAETSFSHKQHTAARCSSVALLSLLLQNSPPNPVMSGVLECYCRVLSRKVKGLSHKGPVWGQVVLQGEVVNSLIDIFAEEDKDESFLLPFNIIPLLAHWVQRTPGIEAAEEFAFPENIERLNEAWENTKDPSTSFVAYKASVWPQLAALL